MNVFIRLIFGMWLCICFVTCRHVSSEGDRNQAVDFVDAARSLVADSQYREALRELLHAKELDPENREVHYLLASVYFLGFQRFDDATKHIQLALKLSKDSYPEAENLYGVILLDQGKVSESLVFFTKATKNLLYATPYFAEQNLGDAYTRLGQLDQAVMHFRNALAAQPDLCGAYLPLAKNLRTLKRAQEAQGALEGFLKTCDDERLQKFIPLPMIASIYYELGLVRLDLKNKKGAKEAFEHCSQRFAEDDLGRKCLSMLRRING